MNSEEISKVRNYFIGVEIKQSTASKAYKSNPEIKSIIDRLLLDVPEYQTPIRAIYCIVKGIELKRCHVCGKLLNYQKSVVNEQEYCSYKCNSNSEEVKNKKEQTCLRKYGVRNFASLDCVKEKRRKTLLNKYGVDSTFKSDSIRDKIKNTMLDRYGVENASQAEFVKEKKKNSAIEKYGVENVFQSEEVKKKIKETIRNKYGTCNVSCVDDVKSKKKETTKNHYGVEVPSKSKIILDKMKNTMIKRYGVEHYCDSYEYMIKKFNKMKENFKDFAIPLFSAEDYVGTNGENRTKVYKWKCVKCGNEFEQHIHLTTIDGIDTYSPRCLKCYPYVSGTSYLENELCEFIKSIYNGKIVRNTRDIISPYELDIYIPDKNIAIEFDGIFWHSEKCVSDVNYHLNKTIMCADKGIHLIHVFEDEWVYKKEIVKDRIKSILGIYDIKIPARKCVVSLLDFDTSNNFLEENHLQGGDKSSVRYGLYYKNDLVSVMTFGKPRFSDKYDFELVRFACKKGTKVIGGAGKLLKHFEKDNIGNNIVSYADMRYSNGKLYESLGFKFIHSSSPNYWWIKDNYKISRYLCQKHNLANILGDKFNPELSENVNMSSNGYYKIYDCGNLVFEKVIG